MRLPLSLLTLLTAVAIAGCSGQANVDVTLSTETPSVSVTPLSAPTLGADQVTLTPLPGLTSATATRTPRPPAATKSPSATVAPLEIGDQSLPIPAGAKETKNIPAVARNFVQNQLKGQSRIGQPQAFQVPGTRDQLAQDYRQELSDAGWQVIPINGLQDPLDVLFAQKANVRATIIFATEDNGSTLLYIIGTRP